MEIFIFIFIYVILVCFAFASTTGLVEVSEIFYDKYRMFIIVIFSFLIVIPLLNIIPIILYLYYLNKTE